VKAHILLLLLSVLKLLITVCAFNATINAIKCVGHNKMDDTISLF